MLQNFGIDWTTRSDGLTPIPHHDGWFGERQAHKPLKAIIGLAILIVLSIVLYEIKINW